MFPEKLQQKLQQRYKNSSLRELGQNNSIRIDFYSNDYLGFAKSGTIFNNTNQFLKENSLEINGSTGSRLLSGNFNLYNSVEVFLAEIHKSESALLFNSGYTANLGFFSTIPQRGNVVLYDELIHASIRDGIQLSVAKSYKFNHNDLDHLEKLLEKFSSINTEIYVVTESVFSMDGDIPNLNRMIEITNKSNAYLVVDEAHALGVFGFGILQKLNLQNNVFARIITFGKALGCHGAVILGSKQLKEYLINFCKPFIYTTGMSPHSVASVKLAYDFLKSSEGESRIKKLQKNISFFKTELTNFQLDFIQSDSAIHCCVVGGNEKTKQYAKNLNKKGFDVKPILYPTVKKGEERLRFCLHNYNSEKDILNVLTTLNDFIK